MNSNFRIPSTIHKQKIDGYLNSSFNFKGWDEYNSIFENNEWEHCQSTYCTNFLLTGYPFYERPLELSVRHYDEYKVIKRIYKFCCKECYLKEQIELKRSEEYYNKLDIIEIFKRMDV